MSIEWKKEYDLGLQEIDKQHRNLFRIMNEIYNIINTEGNFNKVDELLDELEVYTKEHFGLEEKYFDEFNFELKETHKESHKTFKEKILELESKSKEDEIEVGFTLIDYLENWFLGHVLYTDKKYVDLFKENGVV